MNPRLRIAIPLLASLGLSILFVVLLLRQAQEATPETVLEASPRIVVEPQVHFDHAADHPIPTGPVESPYQPVPPRKYPRNDGLHRWNLSSYPEGWDEATARSIHAFFERMADLEKNHRGVPIDDLRAELEDYLASLGPEALSTMGAILDVEPDFAYRRFLLYAIGRLGPRSEEATWVLRDYLMARKENTRALSELKHVIRAMGELQNDTSFETIRQLVNDPSVPQFRKDLIVQLGEHHRRQDAVDTMVDGLRSDNLTSNRNKWAQALKRVADPQTLPDLERAFHDERYYVTKQTILGAIGGIGSPNSISFLENAARFDGAGAVRLSAARALWRVGTPYALDVLRNIAANEKEPKLRTHMESWLQETP